MYLISLSYRLQVHSRDSEVFHDGPVRVLQGARLVESKHSAHVLQRLLQGPQLHRQLLLPNALDQEEAEFQHLEQLLLHHLALSGRHLLETLSGQRTLGLSPGSHSHSGDEIVLTLRADTVPPTPLAPVHINLPPLAETGPLCRAPPTVLHPAAAGHHDSASPAAPVRTPDPDHTHMHTGHW